MISIIGYSMLNWEILILFGIVSLFTCIYSLELVIAFLQWVRHYNYLEAYRKFVPKRDKAKEIDFKIIKKLIEQGKL